MDTICQVYGWSGMYNTLLVTPVQVENSSLCNYEHEETFCGTEILNRNTECGGNLGAPIFCFFDDNLTGIVVEDRFCGSEASGTFLSVIGYQDWIDTVSGAEYFFGMPNVLSVFIAGLIMMFRV